MSHPATHEGDIDLLAELLECELWDDEREAFEDMSQSLAIGRWSRLSGKQRAWAKRRLEDFKPTYENIVSSGKVSAKSSVKVNCGPKVLRPPGSSSDV